MSGRLQSSRETVVQELVVLGCFCNGRGAGARVAPGFAPINASEICLWGHKAPLSKIPD